MNVAVDAQPLLEKKPMGISYMQANTIEALLGEPDLHFTFNCFPHRQQAQVQALMEKYQGKGVSFSFKRRLRISLYHFSLLAVPFPYRWLFPKEADITHFYANYCAPGAPGKTLTTVHDISPYVHSEWRGLKSKIRGLLYTKRALRISDHIITVSQFSKEEMVRHCGIDPARITVIYLGVRHDRFHPAPDGKTAVVRSRYGLPEKYLLYVGSVVKHKNIDMLLRAYAQAISSHPGLPALVIGGDCPLKSPLQKLAHGLGIDRRVVFTGYLPEELVPPLMRGAVCFLFPSLYEGFGLPPLEAMACGVPVICSNAASLPEVTGNAAISLSPLDCAAWARAMIRVCENHPLRQTLSQAGVARAARFTWAQTAQETMEVYRKLLQGTASHPGRPHEP